MPAAMAFSSSHSLSHLGSSVFSFSQAQPWPSFCFHSHLSPLAVPLIGVTTTGGRRDILRGIDYLHRVKKRCHGKLSETNIVIVNGRAKITGMVNDISKTYLDDYSDYKHLSTIVRRSFKTEQHGIPTELQLFLTYISKTEPSRLLNIENHPIFLSQLNGSSISELLS
ncbi:uncharacterized protein LOC142641001 isoform X2 [Castanea sativa]|uniref:uncharacterized protein LOC142641001 isoform X2 n=1 Tax=Castanea sativa TaxID=21020 RepID=UPI003F64B272